MEWLDNELNEVSDEELIKLINNKTVVIFGASKRIMQYIDAWNKERYIIIDSNSSLEGTLFHGLKIHRLDSLSDLCKEDIVVMSVIKDYPYISNVMRLYQIKEFYVQKYISVDQYKKEFVVNQEFHKISREVLGQGKFDFIDFIYDGKFVVNVIETIKRTSDINKHLIVVHYTNELNPDDLYNVWEFYKEIQRENKNLIIINDLYTGNTELLNHQFLDILMKSKKIIFHSGVMSLTLGDFIKRHIFKFREKTYLVIHGGELSWNTSAKEFHDCFSDIGNLVLFNEISYNTLSNLYHFKEDVNIIINNCSFYDTGILMKERNEADATVNILVGHSATTALNHIEAFRLLEKFKDEDIKVFCPLSYEVDESYVNAVISEGIKIFGEKFIAMCEYMELKQYGQLLTDIDIGIFPLTRDCGWTTIYSLLKSGKKVYTTSVNNNNDILKYGIKVFNIDEIKNNTFEEFADCRICMENKRNIREYIETLEKDGFSWNKLYSDAAT
ncbi:MAG: TDP-N-acetylfucosamine:lipid II N-acetylfucosaminyltransferase [Lacrimispora sp.]|uniref:TDP-N-acetylfucosamine:lipid II N-acetylfucosaminyltransferase n=1 Tax=Lacrimispora sp. TaxID=2719234 RepID=UPI0039E58EA2